MHKEIRKKKILNTVEHMTFKSALFYRRGVLMRMSTKLESANCTYRGFHRTFQDFYKVSSASDNFVFYLATIKLQKLSRHSYRRG